MPQKIVIYTKQEYYQEEFDKLKVIWWIIVSILFTLPFYAFLKSLDKSFWVFIFFIALFMYSDLTKNSRTKAYAKIILGAMYFIWGIFFLIMVFVEGFKSETLFGLALGLLFFYLSYRSTKRYTNLWNVLFRRK